MTLTTEVRINWPVPAVRLLDQVTVIAGGDPATVLRRTWKHGDPYFEGSTLTHQSEGVTNLPGQGLLTLASVTWSEKPETCHDSDGDGPWPLPPALVVLTIDNPYGFGPDNRGRWVQANRILPAVADWLDDQGVPRTSWCWEDETAGTYHPGTCDVRHLDSNEPRETWAP